MTIKQNEFMIGVMVTAATLIVLFGVLWLGNTNLLNSGLTINVEVKDANGLTKGDEVHFRGLKVGTINAATASDSSIFLKVNVKGISDIPIDSKFTIGNYSLIGGKVIEIHPGHSKTMLKNGALVKGESESGLSQMTGKISELENKVNKVLTNIENITNEENSKNISQVLLNLNKTIENLNLLINHDLKKSLVGINQIIEKNKEPIGSIIDTINTKAKDFSELIVHSKNASEKLESLLKQINNKQGSLGKLINEDLLYENLNRTLQNLDSLIIDIKKNPSRYFEVKIL
ncbi:mce related protein [bacterium BMS3Abin04]|nr:mce related protein [bacterium BMS3Abin04]